MRQGTGEIIELVNNSEDRPWARQTVISIYLKRQALNHCVLPVLTYGGKTVPITKLIMKKLQVTQRRNDPWFGLALRGKVRNEEIRRRTDVEDVMVDIAKLKWRVM